VIAVMPSFHKVVNGAVPQGTDPTDVALHIEITSHHIHAVAELTAFKQFLSLTEFNFSKPLQEAQKPNALENLLQTQDIFKGNFANVTVATDVFPDLLPKGFEAHTGKAQNIRQLGDSILSVSENTLLHETLKQHFANAFITDVHTVFLQQVLNLPAGIYTLVSSDSLTVAAIEKPGKLQLFNRFDYQTAEDFLYYLLLVCDELKTDREKIPLVLCGTITQQSKIYDVCYRYFSNILFLKPDTGRHYSKALAEVPAHIHFTLYSLANNKGE